jgi:hypothetical protein
MNREEWNELLDSTVTVGGVEKRVADCTPDDIATVLADLREQIKDAETELDSLVEFGRFLKEHPSDHG